MSFPYPYHWKRHEMAKCRSRFHAAIRSNYSTFNFQPSTCNLPDQTTEGPPTLETSRDGEV